MSRRSLFDEANSFADHALALEKEIRTVMQRHVNALPQKFKGQDSLLVGRVLLVMLSELVDESRAHEELERAYLYRKLMRNIVESDFLN